MDLLQLQYFRTIARTENISKAAELLYVAQPNLSVSIKRLETDLGVALFDRRKGKIRLTATGKLFLTYVDSVLDQLEQGIQETQTLELQTRGQVRVCSGIVDLIGELLLDFLPDRPDCSFRQICCDNEEVAERVLSGKADFGFVFGVPQNQGLEYTYLDDCDRVVLLSRQHPLASQPVLTLSQLSGEKIICNKSRDDDQLLSGLSRANRLNPRVVYECDDNRVEVSMLCAGSGVSIAPLSNYIKLKRTDFADQVTFLRLQEQLAKAQLGMIRRQGHLLTRAELAFYQMVSRFFQEEREQAAAFADDPSPRSESHAAPR